VAGYEKLPPFQRAEKDPLFKRAVPLSADLPRYRTSQARRDLVAGLTVTALAVPTAMAYGELAGVSPVNGLYALLLPTIAYVFLGSSRQMVVGPESAISTLVAAAILPLAVAGSANAAELAAVLALMVAGAFFLARLLRLGWIADYFSRPVLVGYIHGVAVVLVISQLGKLVGISIQARQPLDKLSEVARNLDKIDGATVAVGGVALAILLVCRYFAPRFPAALIIVSGAILTSWLGDFQSHGIAVVGHIPSGLPGFEVPSPPLADVRSLIPAALGIFVVSFADQILAARSFAGKHHQHVRASQELLAMGAANVAAGFTQGFPIGGSNSRTAVNDEMGARTQVAGLFAAAALIVTLLFLTGPVQYLPTAVLGAVIISAAVGLVDIPAWRSLVATSKHEAGIAAVTVAAVIVLGVLEALIVAVGLSIADTVRRSARPHDAVLGWVEGMGRYADVSLHPSAEIQPGVVVYRLDDRLFFANADYVKGRVHEAIRAAPTRTSWLVFDAEAMVHVDSTGVEAIEELVRDLAGEDITFVFARLRPAIVEQFDAVGLCETIGRGNFYPTVHGAVEAIV
jgi:sulfate permease, SulP family